jgi:hypothetical protein
MKTRSQLTNKINQLKVDIDFDDAIKEWRTNKKSIGNGSYKYICPVTKNDIKCGKSCYKELVYCWQHRKYIYSKTT